MRVSLLLVALLVPLAGCADDEPDDEEPTVGEPDEPQPPTEQLAISAIGLYPVSHAFDKDTLTVTSGANVTITFSNDADGVNTPHNFALEDLGYSTPDIPIGASFDLTFPAPAPGEYEYVCRVGDHRQEMNGILIVEPAEDNSTSGNNTG